jgi:hypothetical protein
LILFNGLDSDSFGRLKAVEYGDDRKVSISEDRFMFEAGEDTATEQSRAAGQSEEQEVVDTVQPDGRMAYGYLATVPFGRGGSIGMLRFSSGSVNE